MDVKIQFEDNHLIVIDKPAGLLSQSDASLEPSLVDWLRQYFGRHYVGLVHRLDRNTSGLMVVAKRTKAANRLSESLKKGDLIRKYKAYLHGIIDQPTLLENYLLKDEKTNKVAVVKESKKNQRDVKLARLKISPIQTFKKIPATLCEFELDTGRSHQIRVQAAHHGHPLLGDVKYGKPDTRFSRPALHSFFLQFPHPMSGEIMKFQSEIPDDLQKEIQALL